ncbi:hypothetical protein H312_01060 [Anncaliia algerae PRA339]|uniref:Kinetochore protein SPC25 n=1 Tax=Anncaliia algerae PRA339 TaxID=1288291 RepID=A0A059F303_9MICR|nr:hypothetical protein H312_01060 [Anncaliia algerae PRA339]
MDRISLCKEIKQEIFKTLDNYIESLSKYTSIPESQVTKEKEQLLSELSALKEKYEEECKSTEIIHKEREQLLKYIKEDREGYENELQQINERKPFCAEKEILKQNLKDELNRINCKLHILKMKLDKKEEEDKKWKEKATNQANNFRRYLGIDIQPEVKHILRITFFLEQNAYVLIDFKDTPKIVDIWPIYISIEDAQMQYDKLNDFYEFCKYIRGVFKNKLVV